VEFAAHGTRSRAARSHLSNPQREVNPMRTNPGILSSTLPAAVAALASAAFPIPTARASCFVEVEPDQTIAIELVPGTSALLQVFKTPDADDGSGCHAWIEVPLSIFPSSRLATRPADVARSMHDVARAIGIEECDVAVYYENDTDEEMTEQELCIDETFRFGERKHWSVSSEGPCWEAEEEVEVVSVD